ncbi:unnamed protein product [Lymnaea stagnalis]|uniref:Death domain-containing protein n=1 Tax=Lymnaea stagnalis TaxID=6523 RepID=A0AAV2HGZ7_LYMST
MSAKKGAPKSKRPTSGKKGKKEEIEDPIIAFLKRAADELREENTSLKESAASYHDKLHDVIQHVLAVNVDNYKLPEGCNLVDIPVPDIATMLSNLTVSGTSLHSYELRLEELETRITQLNNELAKLLKLKLKIENELKDMERMYSVEDLKVQAKRMWYDCCTTQIFASPETKINSFSSNGQNILNPNCSELHPRAYSAMSRCNTDYPALNEELEIPPLYLSVLKPKARSITLTPRGPEKEDLTPPDIKLPGETHIFDMHNGLRSQIIRSLSKRKGNGNDWRLIAARVGLPDDLIEHWLRMKAPNAMALVMKVWGDSAGATVRMLHRHLVSPQMKEVMLAKMISDFYDVD